MEADRRLATSGRLSSHSEIRMANGQRAPEILECAADTFKERNKLYGDNYLHFGEIMLALFPQGVKLMTAEDFNRFVLFTNCVGKLSRYAVNLTNGGHQDSAHDLCVYAAMLEEITDE